MIRPEILLNAPLALDDGGNLQRGVIYASNESRFQTGTFDQPLTAYTVGWRDPENLDALLELIAPAVEVSRRFSFKKGKNSQFFLTEDDDVRAIGSPFKRIEFSGEEVDARTLNKGLTIRVDHDEDAIGTDWRERYTGFLLQRLVRNDLRRHVALLVAAANNTAKVWGNAANPDADMRTMLRTGKNKSGIRPNRILMGGEGWDLRAESYEAQDTPHAGKRADMSPAEVARKLMIDQLIVSEAVYQSGKTAKSDIVGSIAIGYYARSGMMKDDPSNIKRFVTPTSAGRFRTIVEEKAKYTDITVEHYSKGVITSDLGIEKITATES